MKKVILFLFVLFGLGTTAHATAISGTVNYPNSAGLTGRIFFTLSQQGAQLSTGGCGGPAVLVPRQAVIFTITAGTIQGGANVVGNDCISPAMTYYIVQVRDSLNNILFTENWQLAGASQNIGTIQPIIVPQGTVSIGNAFITNLVISGNCTLDGAMCFGGGSGSGPLLKTNGVANGSQAILDLTAGTGITLTDSGTGPVTISATGGGAIVGCIPVVGGNGAVQFVSGTGCGGSQNFTADTGGFVNITNGGSFELDNQIDPNNNYWFMDGTHLFEYGNGGGANGGSGGIELHLDDSNSPGIFSVAITNVSLTSNLATITATGANFIFGPGDYVKFTGLTNATFLNNQYGIVFSVTPTTAVVSFVHADFGSAADTGVMHDVYQQGTIAYGGYTKAVQPGGGTIPSFMYGDTGGVFDKRNVTDYEAAFGIGAANGGAEYNYGFQADSAAGARTESAGVRIVPQSSTVGHAYALKIEGPQNQDQDTAAIAGYSNGSLRVASDLSVRATETVGVAVHTVGAGLWDITTTFVYPDSDISTVYTLKICWAGATGDVWDWTNDGTSPTCDDNHVQGINLSGSVMERGIKVTFASATGHTAGDEGTITVDVTYCHQYAGTGTPEGNLVGNICDSFERSDGSSTIGTLWLKQTGSGNTGWKAVNLSPALFKTNGTTNGSQSIYNLAAGANITLTDSGTGTVTVAGTGGGGATTPGGSNGQLQYNNSGTFGGFTLAGDCTLSQPTITCTKTLLKTNSVSNGSQSTLNLIPGTGISVTDAGSGNVTIASTGTGGGGGGTVTHTGNLTSNLPIIGNGIADVTTGTKTGTTNQFATWAGATTSARCVDTDVNGNLQVTALDCSVSSFGVQPATPNGITFIATDTVAAGVGTLGFSWPGEPGRSNAGATDTIVLTDRSSCILETNGGAVAVAIAQAGTTSFANNFNFCVKTVGTTVATITPATSQIAGNNGTLAATLIVPPSNTAYCYSFDNANYQCTIVGAQMLVGSLTTTAAASDNITISGMISTGHCSLTATNATAATDITSTYVSAKTTNQITVTHPVSSGRTWDILCTNN